MCKMYHQPILTVSNKETLNKGKKMNPANYIAKMEAIQEEIDSIVVPEDHDLVDANVSELVDGYMEANSAGYDFEDFYFMTPIAFIAEKYQTARESKIVKVKDKWVTRHTNKQVWVIGHPLPKKSKKNKK